jgi:ketosteroid isomerase-like protein
MSQENTQVLQRTTAALNRGDWDGWLGLLDPDFAYDDKVSPLDTPPVIRGAAQMRKAIEALGADLDGLQAELVEVVEQGDLVFCLTRWTGTRRTSGTRFKLVQAIVYRLRNGLIVEGTVFTGRTAAVEALVLTG